MTATDLALAPLRALLWLAEQLAALVQAVGEAWGEWWGAEPRDEWTPTPRTVVVPRATWGEVIAVSEGRS